MIKFITSLFTRKPAFTFVYEEDEKCGGYFVYAKEFPEIGGSGKTQAEALENLLEGFNGP